MLQAFIITLREGVEAALIVGITLAYLAKIGRNDLRKSVYAALGAAFVGSIAAAVIISRLKLNQDIFEGKWKQLKGSLKKMWGKLTDDDIQKIDGSYDRFIGIVQERYGHSREEAEKEFHEKTKLS